MQLSSEEIKYLKDLLRIDFVHLETQRKAMEYHTGKDTKSIDDYLKNRQYMADRISTKISNSNSIQNERKG